MAKRPTAKQLADAYRVLASDLLARAHPGDRPMLVEDEEFRATSLCDTWDERWHAGIDAALLTLR